jgi:hypothetical protein
MSVISHANPEYVTTSGDPNRNHHLEEFVFWSDVSVAAGTRARKPLPSKWTSASVRCYSGFQAVFTEPMPSNCRIRHNMLILHTKQSFANHELKISKIIIIKTNCINRGISFYIPLVFNYASPIDQKKKKAMVYTSFNSHLLGRGQNQFYSFQINIAGCFMFVTKHFLFYIRLLCQF